MGGCVAVEAPFAPDKSEARQHPKYTACEKRPPKVFDFKTSCGGRDSCNEWHCHVLHPKGEQNTKTPDNCCDDGERFRFHNQLTADNLAVLFCGSCVFNFSFQTGWHLTKCRHQMQWGEYPIRLPGEYFHVLAPPLPRLLQIGRA